MKPKTIRALPLLGLALLGSTFPAGCRWWKRDDADRIVLSGNIELTQVDIAFKMPGRLIELAVEEGTEVQKGTLLARLDADQLQKQRARNQAGVAVAESQTAQQSTAIDYQRATLEADVEARKASLAQAEARLAELLAGSRPQEIRQATAAADEARTQHALARQRLGARPDALQERRHLHLPVRSVPHALRRDRRRAQAGRRAALAGEGRAAQGDDRGRPRPGASRPGPPCSSPRPRASN